ncbi:MAG TPA: hypothetical protein VEY93_01855 [Longimicrobium sp.]|nr:hypothetical protein [Longimicrobium sp.]
MWKAVYDWARACVGLAEDVRQLQDEIQDVRRELRDVTFTLQRCMMEVARLGEREEREREVLLLKMENLLLRDPGSAALEVRASPSARACGPA